MRTRAGYATGLVVLFGAWMLPTPRAVSQTACQQQKLLPTNGESGNLLGWSIAFDGDTVLVGAPLDDVDDVVDAGSASVYRFIGSEWIEQQKLVALDGQEDDEFGVAVAISGDAAVVGAFWDDDNGNRSGSAYVFRFDGKQWTQEQKLLAPDGGEPDWFGYSVGIEGDLIVVGARNHNHDGVPFSGAAYLFRFDPDTSLWSEEQELRASDAAEGDGLGLSVASFGSTVVVGAPTDEIVEGIGSGSAYVFGLDGGKWIEVQKLVALGEPASEAMGISASIWDDAILLGAIFADGEDESSGAAYVFRFDPKSSLWVQEDRLVADDGASSDQFGWRVTIGDNVLAVGARTDNNSNGTDAGSAYVYAFDGSSWQPGPKLTSADGVTNDQFGSSVAVVAQQVLVGSPHDDDNGSSSGSAYLYSLNVRAGDLDCDGVVGAADLLVLLTSWGPCADCGDCPADLDGNCTVGASDLLILLANWG